MDQAVAVEMDRGALVWTIDKNGEGRPARAVIGPHYSGEFEVVILCEPEDWEAADADRRTDDDFWGEACFPWPVS